MRRKKKKELPLEVQFSANYLRKVRADTFAAIVLSLMLFFAVALFFVLLTVVFGK